MLDLSKKKLQNTVFADGRYCPIHTDFRIWLKFEREIYKDSPDVSFVFSDPVIVTKELFEKILEFYANPNKYPLAGRNGDPIVDYLEDGEYIYAEFMQKYGINLLTVDLHWHEFLALFRGLLTKFSDVAGYRSYVGNDKSYNEMKSRWRIQTVRKKDSSTEKLEKILRGGGDLSRLKK